MYIEEIKNKKIKKERKQIKIKKVNEKLKSGISHKY